MFRALVLISLSTNVQAEGFHDQFETIDPDRWHVANYDFDHPSFDTDWRPEQAIANDGLRLRLTPHTGMNRFAGASIRTYDTHHYGRYSARIQAAKGDGVVTGFFTYTGAHYGTRHDEIDIEILGRDTSQLHIAWFVDGALSNHFIPLGFDAAKCLHDYAFEWRKDQLAWFVNGAEVFRFNNSNGKIPQVPGHLFANIWAADPEIAVWSGAVLPNTETEAFVANLGFSPLEMGRPES